MQLVPFKPHILFKGGIAQTLAGHFLNSAPKLAADHFLIDLSDGDQLLCEVNHPENVKPWATLILFHGLGGSSESGYMLSITSKAMTEGMRVVRCNHRGCGPGGLKYASQIYHAGRSKDIAEAVTAISDQFNSSPFFLVGFSLSGSMLLNYLASQQSMKNLKASLAVCPPLDLQKSTTKIGLYRNKLFDYYFGFKLVKHLKNVSQSNGLPVKIGGSLISLKEFDEIYTAPLAGFNSKKLYYKANSCKENVIKITQQTTIIYSQDDPIVDATDFTDIKTNEFLTIEKYKSGGHMGFYNQHELVSCGHRWLDHKIIHWAKSNME